MKLVLISTAGNQAYVFASNRLREAVGASYLLQELTTTQVEEVCGGLGAAVLQKSSGSTLVRVPDVATARVVIEKVTTAALRRAPGLQVLGVYVDLAAEEPSAAEVRTAFRAWHRHAGATAGASVRFQRLPAVASCRSTDLPAQAWHSDTGPRRDGSYPSGEEPQPLSAEAIAKRAARPAATARFARLLTADEIGDDLGLIAIDELFERVDSVAVIHADANRLGRIFENAGDVLPRLPESIGERTTGALSRQVQQVATESFQWATQQLAEQVGASKDLPVVPLVIGGDDLTVLIDGRFALAFSREYLRAFGEYAAAQPLLTAVVDAVTGERSVTACAGVAVVKPHFPFSAAYGLADELCRNAKVLAAAHPGTHGLDMHVLLDSTLTDLAAIRAGYLVEHEGQHVELTARPYLLAAEPGISLPDGRDWAEVEPRIRTLRRAPAGLDGGVVTRSQLHALRGEVRTDPARARRRITDLHRRCATELDRELLAAIGAGPSGSADDRSAAGLLDALELAPFADVEATP